MMENNKIALFQEKEIRRIWHNEEWFFSVIDVIGALTDSSQPARYWADIKKRTKKESNQSFAFCEQLKLKSADGKSKDRNFLKIKILYQVNSYVQTVRA